MKKKKNILIILSIVILVLAILAIFGKRYFYTIHIEVEEDEKQEPVLDDNGHDLNSGFYIETNTGTIWFEENKTKYDIATFSSGKTEDNKDKESVTEKEDIDSKDVRQINLEKHEKETGSVGFYVSEPSNSVYTVYIDTSLYPGLSENAEIKVERRTKSSFGWSNWRQEGQISIEKGVLYDWIGFPANEEYYQLKFTEIVPEDEQNRQPYVIYSKIIECIHDGGKESDPGYYSDLRDTPELIPDNSPVPKKIESFEIVENNEE